MLNLLRNRILLIAAVIVLVIPAVSPATAAARPTPHAEENDFKRPSSDEIQKEVAGINAAIKATGAKWIAGETSITRLSPAERKMRLGILAAPPSGELKVYSPNLGLSASGATTTAASSAPGTLDWRSYNGGDFVTPVRDQGQCGDCWAFGSVAALESKTLITQNTPGVNLDLSEQVVNSCDTADNYGDGCNGGNLVTDFFVNTGVPLESCYPYTATDGNCSNACANWQQNAYKTTSYSWIVPYGSQQTVDALKAGLYVYGPLVVTFSVYDDFYSYTSGIYTHTSGSFEGYHAVLLVGYDDTNNCFIVKNSWGTGWGESGFFEIAYSEVNGDCAFGYEALAYGDQTSHNIISCITNPINGGAINGTTCTITGQAWATPGYNLTKVEVSTDGGATWHTATGTGSWSYTWSPLPADGVYTIKSRATDSGGNIETPGSGVTTTIDTVPPSSSMTAPANGSAFKDTLCAITGTAADNPGGSGVSEVDVGITPSGGTTTWHPATGTTSWSFPWPLPVVNGSYNIKSRATDRAGNMETPGGGITVSTLATRPVSTWGYNQDGELGDGSTAPNWTTPTEVSGLNGVEAISCGGWHTAALRYDGTVWTWGYNGYGELGDGTTTNRLTPVQVSGLSGVVAIAGGEYHTVALKSDGTVWAWGDNSGGEIGDGTTTQRNTPVQVSGLTGVVAIAAGGWYTIALKSDGTVWAWGYNNYGQLGDGTTTQRNTPIQVSGLSGITAIACGTAHSIALKSDGTVWTWGWNAYGQLGNGTTTDSHAPVQVSGLSGVTAVAGGQFNTAVIKSNGTAWGWGYNGYGDIGDGTTTERNLPVQTAGISGVTAIACGSGYAIALESGGKVYDWGYNYDGELGDGTTTNRLTPVQVGALNGITATAVSAGMEHTGALRNSPCSTITSPLNGAGLSGTSCTVAGTAWDGSGVQKIEIGITPSGGSTTWYQASGAASWSCSWPLPADGSYTIQSRATDNAGIVETPGAGVTVTVNNAPPSSAISSPANNATLNVTTYTITGTATDGTGPGVQSVHVSTDGGSTWQPATGTTSWSYLWTLPPSGGKRIVMSRAADNAGNVETPGPGVTVTVAPYGNPELPHYNWNPAMIPNGTDCAFCHTTPGTFLAQGFMQSPTFCYSCHNAAGNAHALDIYSSIGQHPIFVNATAFGRKKPTYGNITAGEYNDIPGSRLKNGYLVTCMTCHNAMRKSDDPGRVWEYTTTPNQYKYYLQNGGWSGYGNLTPKVYRDASLWSGPTYSKDKKSYLVDPSEYTYNETSGFVRFKAQQSSLSYIYVTLYYPYLRAPLQDNSLCSDCHTEKTHENANCLNCHTAHNTSNIRGIRENVRTLDYTTMPVKFLRYTGSNSFADGTSVHTSICVVCHTTTKYYRRDGTGFVNHSGGMNYDGQDCATCHSHASGFAKYSQ